MAGKDLPFDYGFGEAMIILQKAQQCAFAIYAINSGAYEPDQLDFEIIHNSNLRNSIKSGSLQQLADHNRNLMDQGQADEAEIRRLREESDRLLADNQRMRADNERGRASRRHANRIHPKPAKGIGKKRQNPQKNPVEDIIYFRHSSPGFFGIEY